MRIIISKYQPNQNRYVRVERELVSGEDAESGGETFFGLCIDARMKPEPGFTALRNHRVDRIEVNSYENTINIFTSPISQRSSKGSGRKALTDKEREAVDLLYKPEGDIGL